MGAGGGESVGIAVDGNSDSIFKILLNTLYLRI